MIVAFVSFDTIGPVLAAAGGYLGLATIEGQVVQPLLVGQRLELNPIIVFLALWFGGWFWAIPGIVLAIPALVALKVAAEHHDVKCPEIGTGNVRVRYGHVRFHDSQPQRSSLNIAMRAFSAGE